MTLARATQAQQQASSPHTSVWVSASAGSGKTKVLIDRVLNLLLAGVTPEGILCLTFTKAAAAEMENRLYERLGQWTTLSETELSIQISPLLNRSPTPEELTLAKQLFARAIDTPGGLKIQTIHGFCQSLLKRFPLESALSPHFTVIDEKKSLELLQAAQSTLLQDPHLAPTLSHLGQILSPQLFTQLNFMIVEQRAAFENLPENLSRHYEHTFGLKLDTNPCDLIKHFHDKTPHSHMIAAATVLAEGSKTDQARGLALQDWVETDDAVKFFPIYASCFLTSKGEPRQKLITAALNTQHPQILPILEAEVERVLLLNEKLTTLKIAQNSYHLSCFGQSLVKLYEKNKSEIAALDYQDLILKASHLLRDASCATWVLYKLDGGIDHILIDEAQDTSPDQWQVITALCEEFFSYTDDHRTLFVVGDDKQSIYSFQGADPKTFSKMQNLFAQRSKSIEKNWHTIDLDVSFRSTPEVLQAVDSIFQIDNVRQGVSRTMVKHHAHRSQSPGHVELWPLVEPHEKEDLDIWPLPQVGRDQLPPPTRLAHLLAQQIYSWLKLGKIVQGRALEPGDIMILVRKRSTFVDQLIRALKKLEVPVAGVDRMILLEQLPVMDLMKLAEFALLPQDDLTLATVLKGPLFNLTEDELFLLAHNREEQSLWDTLRSHSKFSTLVSQLQTLIKLSGTLTPYQFFSRVLGTMQGRKLWQQRMGPEALDPLDELLNLSLTFEKDHTPSLQLFIQWVHQGETQLKRDLDQSNEVRIMTVHGSKGLQAPVVILPDTTQVPKDTAPFLWTDNLCVLMPPKDSDIPLTRALRAPQQTSQEEEYRRLLYVALTRAEDHLYICGWKNTSHALPDNCWYEIARQGLATCAKAQDFNFIPLLDDEGWQGEGYILQSPLTATPQEDKKVDDLSTVTHIPSWLNQSLAPDPIPNHPLTPSQLGGTQTLSALSPDPQGLGLKRGQIVHKLLEILPQLPAEKWQEGCKHFLEHQALPSGEKLKITQDCLEILNNYPELFTSDSQAEVPIIGLVGSYSLSGQIDRLVVTDNAVHVVDYKTNVVPPVSIEQTPEAYIRQLAAYKAALMPLYPDHEIFCSLLWTTLPRLDTIPNDLMNPYLSDPSTQLLAA